MENKTVSSADRVSPKALAEAQASAKAGKYLKYAFGEIVLVIIGKSILCPVRDKTWVETNKDELNPRAFRYEI